MVGGETFLRQSGDYAMHGRFVGFYDTDTAIVGFRYKFASGNISSGIFNLYGVL